MMGRFLYIYPLIFATVAIAAATVAVVSDTCAALESALPGKVLGPDHSAFARSLSSYYVQQEQHLNPVCIVHPTSADDVAAAIGILGPAGLDNGVEFAIRSGGHGINSGAANIEGGITFDLTELDDVSVNQDRSLVSIGVGARWSGVYGVLDSMGLGTVGGRDSRVGVGGFLLGGGVGYLSPRRGFGCDEVVNYEVVLANGTIVNVDSATYPDLARSLKGGGNNFGIVTRVDMNTMPLGRIWGGQIVYPGLVSFTIVDALSNFLEANNDTNYDEFSSLIVSFATLNGTSYAVAATVYTTEESHPPIYREFEAALPQLDNSLRLTNLTDLTQEQAAIPVGRRGLFVTTTFVPTRQFIRFVYNAWSETILSVITVQGLAWPISFQPLPLAITQKSFIDNRQGNSLGFDGETRNLILFALTIGWINEADDEVVTEAANSLFERINAEADRLGLSRSFRYMNYASSNERVIRSYGPSSQAELQRVSRVYDPSGIFQNFVPGGFKLSS